MLLAYVLAPLLLTARVFRATQARAVYEALGIAKHEIERGRPWQNYVETHFNVQRRMADWHFVQAGSWSELVEAHDQFVEDYNAQAHFAHERRDDGRRSPAEMLGFASGVRHREEELRRAFFSSRFVRVLDALGYTRFRHWKIYGEEALAGREAALWLAAESLTVEHGGEPLSRYEVQVEAATGKLRAVARPRLFENSHGLRRPQQRLFELDSLGEGGWLKVMRLEGYAPPGRPDDRKPSNSRPCFPTRRPSSILWHADRATTRSGPHQARMRSGRPGAKIVRMRSTPPGVPPTCPPRN